MAKQALVIGIDVGGQTTKLVSEPRTATTTRAP